MPQIPPQQVPATEISQRAKEDEGQLASRPGEAPTAPPIPDTGKTPFFDPISAPIDALAARVVNNTPPFVSVNLTEKDINTAQGGKPHTPNVIATDATQIITNDQPDDADHRP